MSKPNNKNGRRTVAIKICESEIELAVLEKSRDGKSVGVRTRTMPWREKASTLHGDQGIHELGTALKTLVNKERLAGCKVQIALSGDFSVTRVVAGSGERVRSELRQLEERSSLYLSLGPGAKSVAGAIRQIDVRHQQAWLSATNKRTLDAIHKATDVVGIEVDVVEPSLIALSRALGAMGVDRDAPVMVIEVDESTVELGLSYRGRLLLDHRPAGMNRPDDIATIVDHHMERLRRYVGRHFRHASGEIEDVYLCGPDEIVKRLVKDFGRLDCLSPHELDPREVCTDWSFESDEHASKYLVVLGTALGAGLSKTDRNGPNLMERLRSELREPLLRGLVQATWPVAALLLLSIGLFGISGYEKLQGDALQAELDQLAPAEEAVRVMQLELTAAEHKAMQLERLAMGIEHTDWQTVISDMAHCLPEDVWLESFHVDSQGRMTISGNSFSEDGVFEFVRWLKDAPSVRKVALQSTQPIDARLGPATRFDVRCDLAGRGDKSEQEDQDG